MAFWLTSFVLGVSTKLMMSLHCYMPDTIFVLYCIASLSFCVLSVFAEIKLCVL